MTAGLGWSARRRRAVRALAVVLFCFAAAVGIGVIVVSVVLHQQGISEVGELAIDLTCALVGIVIAWHQPRHPMGWILLGVACFFSLLGVGAAMPSSTTPTTTGPGRWAPSRW